LGQTWAGQYCQNIPSFAAARDDGGGGGDNQKQ